MSILKIKDANGNWQDIPAIKGKDGKDGEVTLEQLKSITGELENLSTEDKSNLVNAINEAFTSASSGGGITYFTGGNFQPTEQPTGMYFMSYKTGTVEGGTGSPSITAGTFYIVYNESDYQCVLTVNVANSNIRSIQIRLKNPDDTSWSKMATIDFSRLLDTGSGQTISGKKTFNILPESSVVPTADNQLVNKKYVDDNSGSKDCPKIYYWHGYSRGLGTTAALTDADRELFSNILNDIQSDQKIMLLTTSKNMSINNEFGSLIFTAPSELYGTDLSNYSGDIYFKTPRHISYSVNSSNKYEVNTMERYHVLRIVYADGVVTRTYAIEAKKFNLSSDISLLSRDNKVEYTPTYDYNPATKKYVDDAIANAITTVLEGEY